MAGTLATSVVIVDGLLGTSRRKIVFDILFCICLVVFIIGAILLTGSGLYIGFGMMIFGMGSMLLILIRELDSFDN